MFTLTAMPDPKPAVKPEGPPLWKKAFDAMERTVAPQLEKAIRTDQFADAAAALAKGQNQMRIRAERASRQAMHAANMATATDVKRISDQLASVERRLNDMAKQQERILTALESDSRPSVGATPTGRRKEVTRSTPSSVKTPTIQASKSAALKTSKRGARG